MDFIVYGGTIVTVGSKGVIRDGALVVQDGEIIDVGKTVDLKGKYPRYERIRADGKVVMPGLINTHQHAAMSLLRGYADDYPLKVWLEEWIWPLEKHMTGHDIYVGALLTAVESILGGITTVNSMYHYVEGENEAKAFAEVGIRGVIGHVCFSWRREDDVKALWNLARRWHGELNGRIRVSVDPHAPYTVDPDYMVDLRMLADDLNEKYGSSGPIIWHIHVAETGDEAEKIREAFNVDVKGGVVEYLDSLNVLGRDVLAVHCVSLTSRDIEILAERGVSVSHNPVSNLKLASGISPVPRMLREGVNVSLGTDSSSSNNVSDMFEVTKIAALLHKGVSKDPTVLPAEDALRMATVNGAKALLWHDKIGSLEVGKRADIILLDFRKPHLTPLYNEVSHIVYSARSSDVDTVIVDGEILLENRRFVRFDVEDVLEAAEEARRNLLSRIE